MEALGDDDEALESALAEYEKLERRAKRRCLRENTPPDDSLVRAQLENLDEDYEVGGVDPDTQNAISITAMALVDLGNKA